LDAETVAAIILVTGGNFRLLGRLLTQAERILEINGLTRVTAEVIDAAREKPGDWPTLILQLKCARSESRFAKILSFANIVSICVSARTMDSQISIAKVGLFARNLATPQSAKDEDRLRARIYS
jgi:hypothetical protein